MQARVSQAVESQKTLEKISKMVKSKRVCEDIQDFNGIFLVKLLL